jgi:hypothetical protein
LTVNSIKHDATSPSTRRWAILLLGVVLAGCGRNDVQVYKVAKETPQADAQATAAGMMPPGHPETAGAAPRIGWKVPEGWQEAAPGEMRVGSFKVAKDGKQAEVSIIPLPGMAGGDLSNVNRWRGQVGQPPVTEEGLAKLAQTVEIAGQPAQLYDQAGQNPGSGESTRILAAIQRREGTAWFFKMTGDDELVAQQKPAFIEFLKSVAFASATVPTDLPPSHPPIGGAAMPGAGVMPAAASTEAKPEWQVPAGWQETQAGAFLVSKFLISGADNDQAAVNVSMSQGEGGGVLSNVNRWRQQLGLAPVSDSELEKLVTTTDTTGGKVSLVDMSSTDARNGQKTRLVGAVVPRSGQTWFYKLMGSEAVVDQQKDAFVKFVQSVKYP